VGVGGHPCPVDTFLVTYLSTLLLVKTIHLQFDIFDIEENLDVLEIWDGGPTILSSQLIARISGQNPGQYGSYISSTHHLLLRFLTDSSIQKQGFRFSWKTGKNHKYNIQCNTKQTKSFRVSFRSILKDKGP
jgi:hypothetical protein